MFQHYLTLIDVSLVYAKCLNSLIYLTFINISFHRAFNPDHFVYLVQFKTFYLIYPFITASIQEEFHMPVPKSLLLV